jgi:hypothetical protein
MFMYREIVAARVFHEELWRLWNFGRNTKEGFNVVLKIFR